MAVKYIDVRDEGDEREEVTQTRYTFESSGNYWVLDRNGLTYFDVTTESEHPIAARGELKNFFVMMEVIGAQETFNRLKDEENRRIDDDIPF